MRIERTELPGVLLITPDVHSDERGRFCESWHRARYEEAGLPTAWAQDNVSVSRRGVIRGLHFQNPAPQGKLVSTLHGEILDVAVDVRPDSPHFRQFVAITLSARNGRQLWIPEGFAHGLLALTDDAVVHYKVTTGYQPNADRTIAWNDPGIGIQWPERYPILSAKDSAAPRLADFPPTDLPAFCGPA